MGLDMYLHRRAYVKNWDYMGPEERHEITVTCGGKPTHIKPERISYIIEQLAYWRKANAIHQWFVDNVQSGKDDCRDYDVTVDQLRQLLHACERVLEHLPLAGKLLPPKEGYFFGGTKIDEYYIEDLEYTVKVLKAVIEEDEAGARGEIYYHSSW